MKYVDYGNTSTIGINKLREPTNAVPNLSRLPYQSVSVVLEGLPTDPTLWSPLELDTLNRYLKDQVILAEAISTDGDYISVKLYIDYSEEEPREINHLMISDTLLFQPPKPAPQQLDVIPEVGNLNLNNDITIAAGDVVRREELLPRLSIGRCIRVIIPYVEDPAQWAFQPTDYYNQLQQQGNELQTFYSQPMHYDDNFGEGELCAAFVPMYTAWYRAKILELDHKLLQAKCHMIDYGDTNIVPLSHLRPLTRAFATLPIQACIAALANVQPVVGPVWDEAAKAYFKECVLEKSLWVKIVMVDSITRRVNAEIIDTSAEDDVMMSDVMVARGCAHYMVPPPHRMQRNPPPAAAPVPAVL